MLLGREQKGPRGRFTTNQKIENRIQSALPRDFRQTLTESIL